MEALDVHDVRGIHLFLQLVADSNWPGHRGGELVIDTGFGTFRLPVAPYRPPPMAPAAKSEPRTESRK